MTLCFPERAKNTHEIETKQKHNRRGDKKYKKRMKEAKKRAQEQEESEINKNKPHKKQKICHRCFSPYLLIFILGLSCLFVFSLFWLVFVLLFLFFSSVRLSLSTSKHKTYNRLSSCRKTRFTRFAWLPPNQRIKNKQIYSSPQDNYPR